MGTGLAVGPVAVLPVDASEARDATGLGSSAGTGVLEDEASACGAVGVTGVGIGFEGEVRDAVSGRGSGISGSEGRAGDAIRAGLPDSVLGGA